MAARSLVNATVRCYSTCGMSDPAEKRVLYRFPDELSPDEAEQMDHVMDVDGEAYLRWLAGEGPDPCPPEGSE
jgi:hypothetical protein